MGDKAGVQLPNLTETLNNIIMEDVNEAEAITDDTRPCQRGFAYQSLTCTQGSNPIAPVFHPISNNPTRLSFYWVPAFSTGSQTFDGTT